MVKTLKTKNELRKEMLYARNAISESERKEISEMIKNKLFAIDEIKHAKCIAFYISKGSEVETNAMIAEAIKQNKEVLVPHTNEKIELVKFTSFEDLAPAKFGVLEPKTKMISVKQPEVVIIPGLAFDLDMHRLGYGKGYYDKLLKELNAKRIGICFDLQIIEKIPKHEHDQKLNIMISEKRILRC